MQDGPVVEADVTECRHIGGGHFGGISGHLCYKIEHCHVGGAHVRCSVVVAEGENEGVVEGDLTQKLCVTLQSVVAAVDARHDCVDHLVLAACEGKIRRHEFRQGGKDGLHDLGQEAMQ